MTQQSKKALSTKKPHKDDDQVSLSLHCAATITTSAPELFDPVSFTGRAKSVLEKENVCLLGELTHKFSNGSFTSAILLAESHITVHTWPERSVVQLDVFLCNYLNDNTEKCERIFESLIEHFAPSSVDRTYVSRL